MRRPRSTFLELGITLAALLAGERAYAQACCAGGSALTPGRLAPQEYALVGVQAKGAVEYGALDADGHYAGVPKGTGEVDLEQDLFAAYRLTKHAQLSLLVPLIETHRWNTTSSPETGGGIGDINFSGRYDFTLAADEDVLVGFGVLAGITAPTGVAVDSATKPLGTDATGIGAWQGNLGLALEKNVGDFSFTLASWGALRTARDVTFGDQTVHSRLAPQLNVLAAGAYVFENKATVALVLSYAAEGNATLNGETAHGSERRTTTVSVAGLYPFSMKWRVLGGVNAVPPIPTIGMNQPATLGLSLGVVRSWL